MATRSKRAHRVRSIEPSPPAYLVSDHDRGFVDVGSWCEAPLSVGGLMRLVLIGTHGRDVYVVGADPVDDLGETAVYYRGQWRRVARYEPPALSVLQRRVEQLEATIAEIGEAAAETLTEVDDDR